MQLQIKGVTLCLIGVLLRKVLSGFFRLGDKPVNAIGAEKVISPLLFPFDINSALNLHLPEGLGSALTVLDIPAKRPPKRIQIVVAEICLVKSISLEVGNVLAE